MNGLRYGPQAVTMLADRTAWFRIVGNHKSAVRSELGKEFRNTISCATAIPMTLVLS
jgi:hypothetical protein